MLVCLPLWKNSSELLFLFCCPNQQHECFGNPLPRSVSTRRLTCPCLEAIIRVFVPRKTIEEIFDRDSENLMECSSFQEDVVIDLDVGIAFSLRLSGV